MTINWGYYSYTLEQGSMYYGVRSNYTNKATPLGIPVSMKNLDLINDIVNLLNKSFEDGKQFRSRELKASINNLKELLNG